MRTICPQVKGIYQNKNENSQYGFLLLHVNNPDAEHQVTEAFKCDRAGNLDPTMQTSISVKAEDFGDYIANVPWLCCGSNE